MEYGIQKAVRGWLAVCACALTACQGSQSSSISASASRAATEFAPAAQHTTASLQFSAARNCQRVGVLFPEVTLSRWEKRDRPLLEAALAREAPGMRIDYANAHGDADVQQEQAIGMLDRGACILIVAAQDSVKATTIVQLAAQRNVPVIAYDRMIHAAELAFLVAHDSLKAGELQGQWLIENAPSEAKLVMINGSPTDDNSQILQRGVMNRLRPLIEQGRLKLVFELFVPNWNSQIAAASVAQVLDANQNNIQVVYVANDDMANAVIGVLQARGLAGKVLVTGQDATADGVRNIVAGWQGMTVFKDPRTQAGNTAALVGILIRGGDPASVINAEAHTSAGAPVQAVFAMPVSVNRSNVDDVVTLAKLVMQVDACALGTASDRSSCN